MTRLGVQIATIDEMAQQQDLCSKPQPEALTVISGGQTGVDRGALDAALSIGAPCGGWCPAGRKAEDGPIAALYPLTEMPTPDYLARTRRNVEASDGTLIITFGVPSGGTKRTAEFCQRLNRPHLIIDAAATTVDDGVRKAVEFVKGRVVRRLNVAGPRASNEPRGYEYAFQLVSRLLARISGD